MPACACALVRRHRQKRQRKAEPQEQRGFVSGRGQELLEQEYIKKKKKKKRLCLKRNATQAELLNKVYVEGLRLGEIEQFWRSAGSNVKDTEN